MQRKLRVAVAVSHPIQHFCPQYESWAQLESLELKVFFASALGYKKYYDANFRREVSWSNIRLENFSHAFLNGEEVLQPDNKLDAPTLEAELSEYAPDLLVTYGYFQRFQRRACRWARRNKVQIAYISDSELRHKRSLLKSALKYPFLRNYFSQIDYFFSVGDANEEFYRHHNVPSEKLVRMHFPIDVASYASAYQQRRELRDAVRKQYHIGGDAFTASVVGKLVPWKNQDHIIDAMLQLEAKGVDMVLFVLGSGKKMDEWKAKAAALKRSKVNFPGFVNAHDLPQFYAASDAYIHPASIEPHSIAVSEAIYMGCPIIISDRCGSHGGKDDVQDGKNGFVYPFGDVTALASRIELLKNNAELRNEFQQYSRRLGAEFQAKAHGTVFTALINPLRPPNDTSAPLRAPPLPPR